MMEGYWQVEAYQWLSMGVLAFLVLSAIVLFLAARKNPQWKAGWISVQSWFLAAPLILLFLGLKDPWPLVALVGAALLGTKEFFQITGMYHRLFFVWSVYVGILVLGWLIYRGEYSIYALAPMVLLFVMSLIPLALNQTQNMLQYLALSLFNFAFIGWGFLHIGWIIRWDQGPILALIVFILSEFSDNVILAASRFIGRIRVVDRISPRRTLEGILLSIPATLFLSYLLRDLQSSLLGPSTWILTGLIAFAGGGLGDLVLAVVRRDLGLKDVGVFILGRGGILSLIDRAIFVGPMYYYAVTLSRHFGVLTP